MKHSNEPQIEDICKFAKIRNEKKGMKSIDCELSRNISATTGKLHRCPANILINTGHSFNYCDINVNKMYECQYRK